jgi:hypothetical protein
MAAVRFNDPIEPMFGNMAAERGCGLYESNTISFGTRLASAPIRDDAIRRMMSAPAVARLLLGPSSASILEGDVLALDSPWRLSAPFFSRGLFSHSRRSPTTNPLPRRNKGSPAGLGPWRAGAS